MRSSINCCRHKAFLRAKDLNLPAIHPREELHQFLIGQYWEYVLPSSWHWVGFKPGTLLSCCINLMHIATSLSTQIEEWQCVLAECGFATLNK